MCVLSVYCSAMSGCGALRSSAEWYILNVTSCVPAPVPVAPPTSVLV